MNRLLFILMAALLIAGCDLGTVSPPGTPEDGAETFVRDEGSILDGEADKKRGGEDGSLTQEEIDKAQAVVTFIDRIHDDQEAKDAEDGNGESPTEPEKKEKKKEINPVVDSTIYAPFPVTPTPTNPGEADPTVIRDLMEPPPPLEAKKDLIWEAEPPAEEEPEVEAVKEILIEAKPTPPPAPPIEESTNQLTCACTVMLFVR